MLPTSFQYNEYFFQFVNGGHKFVNLAVQMGRGKKKLMGNEKT